MIDTDIDIDFANRDKALENLQHIPASLGAKGHYGKHATGVYFQDVPINPITGCSSIPHQEASNLGYFKIDFLNNSVYDKVQSEDHLLRLVDKEPEWELFDEPQIVSMLAHVANHFNIVDEIKPRNIEDLAVILALIRPGKRHLLGKTRAEIDEEIWNSNENGEYVFKRSHAIAFAHSIVMQLNLLVEETNEG